MTTPSNSDFSELREQKPFRDWGLVGDDELARVVVVSPHLDDAVLGCGQLMAEWPGATVVTVFGGNPPAYPTPQREWDRQSGFAPGDDVMAARRVEDAQALAALGATPQHLDFVEYTYNPGDKPVRPAVIAPALRDALTALAPTAVFAPFGLANPDHDVVHRAAMSVRAELPDAWSWYCYEDSGYKHIPGMLAWRVTQLFKAGIWPTPVCPRVDRTTERKMHAVDCYPSQLLALEDDWRISAKLAAPAPEQYWRLAPPPEGWEGLAASV
ncbi:MAG TPA: PIG-L family deacetylase [Acidimicrobiia bacterium]|jgi:LmbE family N-acetylglucosaminyl deacetylase